MALLNLAIVGGHILMGGIQGDRHSVGTPDVAGASHHGSSAPMPDMANSVGLSHMDRATMDLSVAVAFLEIAIALLAVAASLQGQRDARVAQRL
ncbi:hypothetical protein [Nocardia sp. NPDC004860]|uniref:hypothetical protein n=1 Tax=Nocardia sp. NPDC004860 TaxID=3154557 RepID=UPI0033BCB765